MKKSDLFWQTYLSLEQELLALSDDICVADHICELKKGTNTLYERADAHQLLTYSRHLADLLVRISVEIEAISKELYFDNGGTEPRESKELFFDTSCIAFIETKWGICGKSVIVNCPKFDLVQPENTMLFPLKKMNKGCKQQYWAKCYQAVKHDRFFNLSKGNVKACIHALAALFLLNLYNKNETKVFRYSDYSDLSLSFGSSIFMIPKPTEEYIFGALNGIRNNDLLQAGQNPYILKFTNRSYGNILLAIEKMKREKSDFISNAPEMKETEFVLHIQALKERRENDPSFRYDPIIELFKYRIKKRIPSSLPFSKKKSLLLNSPEWGGWVRNHNPHLLEEELNEQNIDSEIEKAGESMGLEVLFAPDKRRLYDAFNTEYCELVLDKKNVFYSVE